MRHFGAFHHHTPDELAVALGMGLGHMPLVVGACYGEALDVGVLLQPVTKEGHEREECLALGNLHL